jgi:hypothetical protein
MDAKVGDRQLFYKNVPGDTPESLAAKRAPPPAVPAANAAPLPPAAGGPPRTGGGRGETPGARERPEPCGASGAGSAGAPAGAAP